MSVVDGVVASLERKAEVRDVTTEAQALVGWKSYRSGVESMSITVVLNKPLEVKPGQAVEVRTL